MGMNMDAGNPDVRNLISKFENINVQPKTVSNKSSSETVKGALKIDGFTKSEFVNRAKLFGESNIGKIKNNVSQLQTETVSNAAPGVAKKEGEKAKVSYDSLLEEFQEPSETKEENLPTGEELLEQFNYEKDAQAPRFQAGLKDEVGNETNPLSNLSDNLLDKDAMAKTLSDVGKGMRSKDISSLPPGPLEASNESSAAEIKKFDGSGDIKSRLDDGVKNEIDGDVNVDLESQYKELEKLLADTGDNSDPIVDKHGEHPEPNVVGKNDHVDVGDAFEELGEIKNEVQDNSDLLAEFGWAEIPDGNPLDTGRDLGLDKSKDTGVGKNDHVDVGDAFEELDEIKNEVQDNSDLLAEFGWAELLSGDSVDTGRDLGLDKSGVGKNDHVDVGDAFEELGEIKNEVQDNSDLLAEFGWAEIPDGNPLDTGRDLGLDKSKDTLKPANRGAESVNSSSNVNSPPKMSFREALRILRDPVYEGKDIALISENNNKLYQKSKDGKLNITEGELNMNAVTYLRQQGVTVLLPPLKSGDKMGVLHPIKALNPNRPLSQAPTNMPITNRAKNLNVAGEGTVGNTVQIEKTRKTANKILFFWSRMKPSMTSFQRSIIRAYQIFKT